MLRRALQGGGYTVFEAEDGGAGLDALSGATVDLVITDIIMPRTEDIETILALQRGRPDLKVIAISGGGPMKPEGYLDLAKEFGAVHVLSKPFDNEELFAAIKDALK